MIFAVNSFFSEGLPTVPWMLAPVLLFYMTLSFFQMMKLRRGVDILVATPGRLLDLHRQNAVKCNQIRTLVLDEADKMMNLGFKEEITDILELIPHKR